MHSASICDASYCPSPTALAAQGIGRLQGGRVPSFFLTPCLVSVLKREEHFMKTRNTFAALNVPVPQQAQLADSASAALK